MNRRAAITILSSVPFLAKAGEAPIRVLIVDGFSNHDWAHTTRILRELLETAKMEVAVSTFPADASAIDRWNPNFAAYDVVIQNCNDIQSKTRWPPRVEVALEDYVRSGGGLFAFHSANNAFVDWKEYNRMIGLGWRRPDFGWAITLDEAGVVTRVPAGEGGGTGHGKRVDAVVTRVGEHPIHAGLPRKWIAADTEVYRYARGPAEALTVLSFAKDEQTGLNFPMEWVVAYGEGRVYSSTLGHVWHHLDAAPAGARCAAFQTLVPRVVQWLAKRSVNTDVPADFPSAETSRLR